MSQDLITENTNLKAQLEINKQNSESANAQLEAHKQMLNETLQASLNLRTTLVLFQKKNQDNNIKIGELQKQLDDAIKKVAELSAPKVEEVPA